MNTKELSEAYLDIHGSGSGVSTDEGVGIINNGFTGV